MPLSYQKYPDHLEIKDTEHAIPAVIPLFSLPDGDYDLYLYVYENEETCGLVFLEETLQKEKGRFYSAEQEVPLY